MLQKRVGILVIALIGSIIAFNLQAIENSTSYEREQIKLYEKAIQENPDISTITSWFGSPEYLVKRYNAGKKEAESVWIKNQAAIQKVKNLGATKTLEVLPLVDWHTSNDQLIGEPGVSYLIKTDQSTILFDVGLNSKQSDPSPLIHNMKQLGVTIDDIDAIVISHNHRDHVGGKMWSELMTFSLGNEQADLGKKSVFTPVQMTYPGLSPICTEKPTKISKGVTTIGTISNQFFFLGLTPEQAIAVNVSGKGIVLIVGCGHQTLGKLLERTKALFDMPVYGIIGGLHYPVTESRVIIFGIEAQKYFGTGKTPWEPMTLEDVQNNINLLKDVKPGLVALSAHDSCDASINEFRKTFGPNYRDVKVGEPIIVGSR
jgi:7,8-dihydropterin-6-yl-methyl-4-(beta-D-ribofuranosyl)aminobenzene 5'-phosphate synthase